MDADEIVEALRMAAPFQHDTKNSDGEAMRAAADELEKLGNICGQFYQVLGSLSSDFGIFDHPLIQRALTSLSQQEYHEDTLPWPSKSPHEWRKEAEEAPESVEHIEWV